MKLLRKLQYNSPVVLSFALISLLSLALGYVTNGWTTAKLFSVYRSSFADPLTYLRFFLHVLGHIDYSHYMNNMLLLLVIGPALEEKYGSIRLLISIAATAFISGIVQFSVFPATALLGASGIVFMMIVMASLSGMKSGRIPLTLVFVLIFYIGGELVAGLTASDNISQLSHIIGGVCGAAFGSILSRFRSPESA